MDRPRITDSPTENLRPSVAHERVVLTGFMGSGKTTIGRNLARNLGWRFLDLDAAIEQRDGRTVATIFAESGEARFRALESAQLASALNESQLVLALGGGALETAANRHLLSTSPHTRIVFLTASFDTLYDRCQRQIAASATSTPVRPLLGDRDAAAARLARRDPAYRDTAHIILDTTGQQPDQTVDALLELLSTP